MKQLLLIFISLMLFACQSKSAKPADEEKHVIGGSKDTHGCLTSAGYTWSELRQDCVRLFECGIRLNPVDNTNSYTTSAFLVFSNDSNQVEVFIPDSSHSTILSLENMKYSNINSDIIAHKTDSMWILSINGKIRYENSILNSSRK
ncbi:MAG: hypothetical protein ACRCX4_14705 [Bacteroidales bacterium]